MMMMLMQLGAQVTCVNLKMTVISSCIIDWHVCNLHHIDITVTVILIWLINRTRTYFNHSVIVTLMCHIDITVSCWCPLCHIANTVTMTSLCHIVWGVILTSLCHITVSYCVRCHGCQTNHLIIWSSDYLIIWSSDDDNTYMSSVFNLPHCSVIAWIVKGFRVNVCLPDLAYRCTDAAAVAAPAFRSHSNLCLRIRYD
jgi:hypothetical protein